MRGDSWRTSKEEDLWQRREEPKPGTSSRWDNNEDESHNINDEGNLFSRRENEAKSPENEVWGQEEPVWLKEDLFQRREQFRESEQDEQQQLFNRRSPSNDPYHRRSGSNDPYHRRSVDDARSRSGSNDRFQRKSVEKSNLDPYHRRSLETGSPFRKRNEDSFGRRRFDGDDDDHHDINASPYPRRNHESGGQFHDQRGDDHGMFQRRPVPSPPKYSQQSEPMQRTPLFPAASSSSNPQPFGGQPKPVGKVMPVNDLIEAPGRYVRPPKLALIFRGLPGSGKSHVAKALRTKEAELGHDTPRILSMDDYFECDGVYEYDEADAAMYRVSLKKAFKKQCDDSLFNFLIVDGVNAKTEHYAEIYDYAKAKGFEVIMGMFYLQRNWKSMPP